MIRRSTILLASACLALSLGRAQPALAQSGIDPAAVQAAKRMADHLRTLQTFEVASDAVLEFVGPAGEKVPLAAKVDYRVQRPNAFAIDLTAEKKARRFIYDGKSFTVFAPKVGYFATVSAPATIDQTVEAIYETYGIVLPLADLFYWGSGAQPTDGLTSAKLVGREKIAGSATDHYAYGTAGLTWEIWIQRSPEPLPLKLRIVTTDAPGTPTYTATLAWKPRAAFAAGTFTFTPATDAKPIAMAQVGP